jgi:hypothetical protein
MKLYKNYSSNMLFCDSYDFQCCHNFLPFHLFWTIKIKNILMTFNCLDVIASVHILSI